MNIPKVYINGKKYDRVISLSANSCSDALLPYIGGMMLSRPRIYSLDITSLDILPLEYDDNLSNKEISLEKSDGTFMIFDKYYAE